MKLFSRPLRNHLLFKRKKNKRCTLTPSVTYSAAYYADGENATAKSHKRAARLNAMSSSAPNRRLPGEEPALFRVAAGGSTRARSSIDRLTQPNGGGRTGFAQGRSALGLFEGRRHVAPTLGQWHGSGAQGQAALRMRPRTPFPVARATPSPPLELPLARAALTQPHPSSRIIACLLARFALASDALSPRYPETLLLLTPLGLGAVPASKTICGFWFLPRRCSGHAHVFVFPQSPLLPLLFA